MSKKKKDLDIIGIDFNNLDEDFCGTIKKVDSSQDLTIINDIFSAHNSIKSILSKRKNDLQTLEKSWKKGNISQTIKELTLIKDKGVSCDFFNSVFMVNMYNKDSLKLDDYILLLPLIVKLVGSKYELNFRCGIKMVCMIFDMYSDAIKQGKRTMKVEPKTMDNYNKLIEFFELIPTIETIKVRDLKTDKNLNELLKEMKEFCDECKK